MSVVVVNFGVGNLGAIPNMLKRLGAEAEVTSDPERIAAATKLIMPGVGAFDAAARNIRELGLLDVLNRKVIDEATPVLGLCLGMQLFGEGSEEGGLPGLGWIKGQVVRFHFDNGNARPVPHMGWNYVRASPDAALFAGFEELPRFYFAHSYYLACADVGDIAGTTHYGYEIPVAVQRGNILGVQFHPEKSHRFGLRIFERFLAL